PAAAPTGGTLRANLGGAGAPALPIAGARIDPAKPFRVHVASFRTKSKVEEIVRSLQARKLDAWFEPPPEGGTWYRVFVGHFATEAEAATYAQWLVKSGAADRAESYPQTKR
ncbi:MAG: SPOR domain-containing protein, partial [Bacteroidota bacterium]